MGKRKLQYGTCRLCNEDKDLNYEHVPPRCTFNRNTRFVQIPMLDFVKDSNPFEFKAKGKVEQGGIGFFSFCQECNNKLGTTYVRAYKRWVQAGAEVLSKGKYDIFEYRVKEMEPVKILKHVISMFIAVHDPWFVKEFPDLQEFVNDPGRTDLNDRFKIYTYLNRKGAFRHIQFTVSGSMGTGSITKCTELAHPPFGYVLTFDKENLNKPYLGEITNFKNFDNSKSHELKLKLAVLETHLPFPLDYRTKDEIDQNMKGS